MDEVVCGRGFSGFHYRHSFLDGEVTTVELQDSRQHTNSLPVVYPDGVPVSHKYYHDIQVLIKYVPHVDSRWFVSQKLPNTDPVRQDLQ